MPQLPTEQDLQALLSKLKDYKARSKPQFSLMQSIFANPNDYASIATQMQRQSLLFDQVIDEYCYLLDIVICQLKQQNNRIDGLLILVEAKNNKVQELKQALLQREKERDNLAESCRFLVQSLQSYKQSAQQQHLQSQKQKASILEKLNDYEIHSERHLEVFQQIKQMNLNINQQMRQTFSEKTQLQQQVADLNSKIIQKDKEIMIIYNKLERQIEKNSKLTQIIKKQQQNIKILQDEIENLKQNLRNPYGRMDFDVQMFTPPQSQQQLQVQQSAINGKVKLSEDVEHESLQNKIEFEMEIIQHSRQISPKIKPKQKPSILQLSKHTSLSEVCLEKTLSKVQAKKKPILLDPYYCHFILLSQTIKILSNEQTYFNIDMKPHYKQIIQQNVPIFEWRQWLMQKFDTISSKNNSRNSSMDINAENNMVRKIVLNLTK